MIDKIKKQRGASMVEYVILLGGIALTMMVTVSVLGQRTSSIFSNAATSGFSSSSSSSSNPTPYNGGTSAPPGYTGTGTPRNGTQVQYGGQTWEYNAGRNGRPGTWTN